MENSNVLRIPVKLKSKMGWTANDLVCSMISSNGKLNFDDYKVFWDQMTGNEREYFEFLVEEMCSENGRKIMHSDKKICDAVLNTLSYLFFLHDSSFMKSKTRTYLAEMESHYNFDSELNLLRLFANKNGNFEIELLKEVITGPIRKKYSDHNYNKNNELKKCFYQIHIVHKCENNITIKLKVIFFLLEELRLSNQHGPEEMMSVNEKIFIIKFLICKLLNSYEGLSTIVLHSLKEELKKFFFWTEKTSLEISSFYNDVVREKCFKGFVLLKLFAKESFTATVNLPVPLKNYELKTVRAKPLFYVSQKDSDRTNFFKTIMELYNLDIKNFNNLVLKSSYSTKTIRLLLTYLINANYGVTTTDITNLSWLTKEQLNDHFNKIVSIVSDCINRPNPSLFVNSEMKSILNSFYKIACENVNNPSTSFVPLKSIDLYPLNFRPDLPPYGHVFPNSGIDMELLFPMLIQKYTNFITKKLNNTDNRQSIKIIVFGGRDVIKGVIKEYVNFITSYDIAITFDFYLVPTVGSLLSTYIATFDILYFRSIFNPFNKNTILPFFDSDNETFQSSLNEGKSSYNGCDKLESPGLLYRQLIDDYVRYANCIFKLCIFDIKLWPKNDENPENIKNEILHDFFELKIISAGKITIYPTDTTDESNEPLELSTSNMEKIVIEKLAKVTSDRNLIKASSLLLNFKAFYNDHTIQYRIAKFEYTNINGFVYDTELEKHEYVKMVVSVLKVNSNEVFFPIRTFVPVD